ncbi:MAG: nucleoside recognition domain-containing protein [Pseudomonadota bacterium]|nr:nucleoside recognition domain-containing protein [Pseudomonadota bacterium]MEC8977430.1 nucleoside recognition domain-containing protein [Pseudomonadota bacterium]
MLHNMDILLANIKEAVVMFNTIWLMMILVASFVAMLNGKVDLMVNHIPVSAQKGFTVALGLVGPMAFWLGLVKVAEDSGLVNNLVYVMKPIVQRLFPDIPADHPAMGSVLLSIASNMLGLNNAGTPIAIRAMQALQKINQNPVEASNAMCLFMCINASSVQLIPTTAIAILTSAGSQNPMQIVTTALLATSVSTIVSISVCIALQKMGLFQTKGALR